MAPQVGTVRHRFVVDFKKDVVQVKRVRNRRAGGNIKERKIKNLRLLLRREQVTETDFVGSADHAVGLNSAQLALLNLNGVSLAVPADNRSGNGYGNLHADSKIDTAADNLLRLAVTDVDRADTQFVGIRMRIDRLNLTDKHLVKTLGEVFHVFHLNGVHREVVRQFLQVGVVGKTNIIFNPG